VLFRSRILHALAVLALAAAGVTAIASPANASSTYLVTECYQSLASHYELEFLDAYSVGLDENLGEDGCDFTEDHWKVYSLGATTCTAGGTICGTELQFHNQAIPSACWAANHGVLVLRECTTPPPTSQVWIARYLNVTHNDMNLVNVASGQCISDIDGGNGPIMVPCSKSSWDDRWLD
jgi:hypothetical protein